MRARDTLSTRTIPEVTARPASTLTPATPGTPAASAPQRLAGLDSATAARILATRGPNELHRVRGVGVGSVLVSALANPLILVLLAASVIAAFVGEAIDAGIIVVMVVLSAALNVVQTYRSGRAAERLRQSVAPTATVLRDDAWREIPRREVVPDDIIRLVAGDLVPADALLLEGRDLHVQQAALTGESLPVEKEPGPAPRIPDPTARSLVFLGTSVVSGTAVARVLATGSATAFGEIAARLGARPPQTEFERGIARFGLLITKTVFFLVLFVVIVSISLHHDPLESLLFAVALAVGLVPEFMPVITSVTLANGAVRMARHKVIVKHLAAIENFGSIDVLCSDKTGTITRAEMVLEQALDLEGRPCDRVLELAHLNAHFETGIRSPLDEAIDRAYQGDTGGWEKLDEIPFDFERRRLSVAVLHGTDRLLVTTGAAEGLLACGVAYDRDGARSPLDDAARHRAKELLTRMGDEGLRVLAVATRALPIQAAYSAADEHDLVLAGFLTFSDPPLEDAATVLGALRRDGVGVKILTGDDAAVARHVCGQAGLAVGTILTGAEVDRMTDAALGVHAEQTAVFARLSPRQKLRVIVALRARGHVVGYLGDGINDAPSLHAADVGISVSSAVDVAKDAADIILLERDLGALHTGIVEGRRAFGNVMKYLLMGTSSNFGNMFSMAFAALVLPFLPMLPTQILLNNFLYDLAQLAIPTDRVDDEFTSKPHRWNVGALRKFMLAVGPLSSIFDFTTFAVLLFVFRAAEPLFHTGWFVESLVTQTLVLLVIRTPRRPLRSRPSGALATTIVIALAVGVLLPFSPLAAPLGFTALPAAFLLYVALATLAYLTVVELAKRRLLPVLLRE